MQWEATKIKFFAFILNCFVIFSKVIFFLFHCLDKLSSIHYLKKEKLMGNLMREKLAKKNWAILMRVFNFFPLLDAQI